MRHFIVYIWNVQLYKLRCLCLNVVVVDLNVGLSIAVYKIHWGALSFSFQIWYSNGDYEWLLLLMPMPQSETDDVIYDFQWTQICHIFNMQCRFFLSPIYRKKRKKRRIRLGRNRSKTTCETSQSAYILDKQKNRLSHIRLLPF